MQRVACAAAVSDGVLLDPAAALVQRVTGQADHVKWVHHRGRVGQLDGGGGLEPGEPSMATTSTLSRQVWGRSASHSWKVWVERPGTMSSSRAGPVADTGQVDDHGDVLLAAASVPPDVLVAAYDRDAV